jgi:hypothetical protein
LHCPAAVVIQVLQLVELAVVEEAAVEAELQISFSLLRMAVAAILPRFLRLVLPAL